LITPDWYSAATFLGAITAGEPDTVAGAAQFDLLLITCVYEKAAGRCGAPG
jgi:hypothetical protein